jgi:sugar phosphate isomerase/epimerase
MVKFGASLYCVSRKIVSGEWGIDDACLWFADQGIMDIELVPFGLDFFDERVVVRCADAARKSGVNLCNFSLNANFLDIDSEAVEAEFYRVEQYLRVAAQLGIKSMRVDCSSFRRDMAINSTAHFIYALPVIIDSYKRLCLLGEVYGVRILLENHGFFINGSERVIHVFEALKHHGLGGQIDVGNFECVDESGSAAIIKTIQYADIVHMKDFYMRNKAHDPGDASLFDCSGSWFRSTAQRYLRGAIFGQGDTDVRSILATIKASKFDGAMYVEFEGMEDCLYGTKVSFNNMVRLYGEA